MRTARSLRFLLCSAGVALSCVPSAAPAQSASDEEVQPGEGEIVVTATRQAQTTSKVPLSISAYSQASLDRNGVRDMSDIMRQTPGVLIETGRTASNLSIRGISAPVGAATVGVYVDDTPIQVRALGYGGGNAYPKVFDLERVEVLRGPQGTLFGAGSEGGTIRFITPQPSLSDVRVYARGEVATTAHGGPSYEAGVAVGAPLVADTLGVRVSGYFRRDGGYVDRRRFDTLALVEKDSNWTDSYVVRAAATWSPVPELKITPAIFMQKIYQNESGFSWDNLSDYEAGTYVNGNPIHEGNTDKLYLPTLNVSYAFGGLDLIAVASYFDRTNTYDVDYTTYDQSLFTGISFPSIPGQQATSAFINSQKGYTGEIRLQSSDADAPLRWVAGGFWQRAKQIASQEVDDVFFPIYIERAFGVPYTAVFGRALVGGRLIYDQLSQSIDEQYAAFGEVNYRPVEPLTLTVGLRYGKTKFSIDADARGPVVGPDALDRGTQEESPLTPKFGASFQIDPSNMVYLSASKGFRPGGYNPAVGAPCAPQLAAFGLAGGRPPLYEADSVWSYELGTKNKFFGGAVQLEASVYQIDWNNIQQLVALNSCGFAFVANLGKVRSRGFDVQTTVTPMDGLTLSMALGFTDATFRETIFGGPTATAPIVSEGDHVTTPPWTVSVQAEYAFPLLRARDGYVRAGYDYRAFQDDLTAELNPANGADPTLTNAPAVNYVTLRAGVRIDDVDVSLFVNNLLDETIWTSRGRDNGNSILYRSFRVRPRTFGLTASYRY